MLYEVITIGFDHAEIIHTALVRLRGKLAVMVRVPSPVGAQGHIEQAILRRFLEEFPPTPASRKPAEADGP